MELKGEFKSILEIIDLFQIISLGEKNEKFLLLGKEGKVLFYFKEGKIINFDTDIPILQKLKEKVFIKEILFKEAIKSVMHYVFLWEGGKFHSFEEEINVEEVGNENVLDLIMEFTKEIDELPSNLTDLLKKISSFSFSEELVVDKVTLDKKDWKILVRLIKGEPIKEVIFSFMPLNESLNKISKFINAGLIKVDIDIIEKEKTTSKLSFTPVIPQDKLESLKEILIETMGPMGEFLIDEALEELEVFEVPIEMSEKFVETLIEKIPESCITDEEIFKERLKKKLLEILET
ncbi:DUF4388 domain-containing protein [Desulfurobacterium thermolithotrophum]|uniref:DUF4388 domain-containing protein n=1 Tax=Desulfurobacterium thermolithotrophum TaxID=64160 RepID=UPI0013D362C3|nr:DUF4388 domain-containing protein [Desulfurobacterium thermolithotrophum]